MWGAGVHCWGRALANQSQPRCGDLPLRVQPLSRGRRHLHQDIAAPGVEDRFPRTHPFSLASRVCGYVASGRLEPLLTDPASPLCRPLSAVLQAPEGTRWSDGSAAGSESATQFPAVARCRRTVRPRRKSPWSGPSFQGSKADDLLQMVELSAHALLKQKNPYRGRRD